MLERPKITGEWRCPHCGNGFDTCHCDRIKVDGDDQSIDNYWNENDWWQKRNRCIVCGRLIMPDEDVCGLCQSLSHEVERKERK